MSLNFMMKSSILSLLSVAGVAYSQSTAYEQCGGIGWTGATTCIAEWTCTYSNAWYSQCLPCTGSCSSSSAAASSTKATTSTTKATTSTAKATTSTTLATSTTGTKTTSGAASTTISGSTGYPGTTLQSGYYWIRAVESPNFHDYLQTSPEYSVGTAILDSYTTAGQFNIVNGQLVELTASGLLYANVEVQPNSSVTMLSMSFETTQNTYGTFDFSGDAVQWSVASITRPNLSAWLVCANQQLFINLGAYDYLTPTGCADETIHYYNGATAVD